MFVCFHFLLSIFVYVDYVKVLIFKIVFNYFQFLFLLAGSRIAGRLAAIQVLILAATGARARASSATAATITTRLTTTTAAAAGNR